MSQDLSTTAQSADSQTPSPNFKALRFRVALIFGLIAAGFALIASAILFIGDEDIRLYAGFSEFDRTPADDCNCDPNAPQSPVTQDGEPDSIGEHLRRMSKRFQQFITEFVDSFSDHHVAGVSRFLAVIAILASTFITYRALLIDRFENEARKNMITAFSHSTRHLIGIFFVPLIAAVLSHILLSEGWILLADMFEDVKMTAIGAIFITTISVGTLTFIVVRWAVAISSRDLLMFGLLMVVIGLSAGFAVADGNWWEEAVSQVGKDSESDLLFTITLVGIALIFFLLWIDLDKLIRDVVGDKFKLTCALYFAATISLAFIGLFPRLGDDSGPYDATYILTFLFHTGGAFVALIVFLFGGMTVFTVWMTRQKIFSRLFKTLSLTYVVFAVFEMIAFVIDESNNPSEVTFINLTAVELIAFVGIGLWFYGALDHLLTRANSEHATDNPYEDLPARNAAKGLTNWQRHLVKRLAAILDFGDEITVG